MAARLPIVLVGGLLQQLQTGDTLVGAGATDPPIGTYAPGSIAVAAGTYAVMVKRLALTGAQRATLAGRFLPEDPLVAEILLDAQGTGVTPAAGKLLVYPDSSSKQLTVKDDAGRILSLGSAIRNWNTADVVASAADTYLTGSVLAVPQHLLQAGATLRWRMFVTKTAAGVAAPIWSVRIGTLGTTGDAARLTFTGPAQTAVVDAGYVEINAILRNVGAAGVLAGGLNLAHNLATTGFANVSSPTLQVTSSAFDTTVAGLKIGLSVNPGAAGVWTHQVVVAELLNV